MDRCRPRGTAARFAPFLSLPISGKTRFSESPQSYTTNYKVRRHDGVVDAVLLAALDSNLVVCREVAKHFQCPFGSGESITPDGAIVLADGTVIALDVTVIGNSDAAKE